MKVDAYATLGKSSMKRLQVIPLVLGLFLTSAAGLSNAQGTGDQAGASVTRAQVKMERDEFLKTHRWDDTHSAWVSVKDKPRQMSTLTRAHENAETRQFVRTHRWDDVTGAWVEQSPANKK